MAMVTAIIRKMGTVRLEKNYTNVSKMKTLIRTDFLHPAGRRRLEAKMQ
jgi:hypothetical protein